MNARVILVKLDIAPEFQQELDAERLERHRSLQTMSQITSWVHRLNLNDLPLAWLQLKRQPVRYLVAVTGIGFAALLMYMQLGFQSASEERHQVLQRT